mmetsp:Transcript_105565/g.305388  ORF Transcript_105565/g.305388 Transcript_105565/m.305388 type:complete len:556 (+) Transcript_105565:58-1725(+)
MGAVCCTEREGRHIAPPDMWLSKTARLSQDLGIAHCGIRGTLTIAKHDFKEGDVVLQELPVALLFPHRDPPWLAAVRHEIALKNAARAWHYCLATHCLATADLPHPPPEGLRPLSADEAFKVMELGIDSPAAAEEQPSELAMITARHVLQAMHEQRGGAPLGKSGIEVPLARRLDAVAARISKHGVQVADTSADPPSTADALFYRCALINICTGGSHTAMWDFDPQRKTLTVRAVRALAAGDELTFDVASQRWLGRSVSHLSSKHCACTACCHEMSQGKTRSISARLGNDSAPQGLSGERVDEKAGQARQVSGGSAASTREPLASPRDPTTERSPTRELGTEEADRAAGRGDTEPQPPAPVMAEEESLETEEQKAKQQGALRTWGADYIAGSSEEAEARDEEAGARSSDRGLGVCPEESCAPPDADDLAARVQDADDVGEEFPPQGSDRICRLDTLLRDWGGSYVDKRPGPTCSTASTASAAGNSMATTTTTCTTSTSFSSDDARVSRVLQRCEGEGLTVNHSEVERLLREEDGHIGKVMIILRRVCRAHQMSPR